jgi:cytochrome P450
MFWSDQLHAWAVSRYNHVATSLKDTNNLSNENRQGLLFNGLAEGERQALSPRRHYLARKDVIGSDSPDHTRIRALVQKVFTPRTIAPLEACIRQLSRDQLDQAVKCGSLDFVGKVVDPLPVILIAEMLGAPIEDRLLFKRWSADILGFQGTGKTTVSNALVF